VHTFAQRLRDLPDLLDAERPHLRVVALQAEPVERRAGQMPLRALGENRHARDDVRARLEVRELLALAPAALVAGADADDAPAVDEQLLGRGLGEDRRARASASLAEPAAELRERRDVVAVVAIVGGVGIRSARRASGSSTDSPCTSP
jgi:hypothetical protein